MNENPGEQQQQEQKPSEQSTDSTQVLPRPTPFVSSEGKPCPILFPLGYPPPIPENYID